MTSNIKKHNPSGRGTHENVKTARRRSSSSTRWLQRQLNDPYVNEAKRLGYRSRATFKILDIDEKFGILQKGNTIVDLGAAPGGWTQIAVQKVGEKGKVVALDILPMDSVAGAICIQQDFTKDEAPEILFNTLGDNKVDVVLSDMAANTTGHAMTDHLRIMYLLELAYDFAKDVLSPGGSFVAKVFQGGAEQEFLKEINKKFSKVRHFKPPSSRKGSSETYIIATGFKG
ncbi:MAG: RlmE family RNA methyltransferase [Alphaproteobacteria bacterium]|nr:RlmE family RNA methyltransferase [Alphaproteobacteria bacterium]